MLLKLPRNLPPSSLLSKAGQLRQRLLQVGRKQEVEPIPRLLSLQLLEGGMGARQGRMKIMGTGSPPARDRTGTRPSCQAGC